MSRRRRISVAIPVLDEESILPDLLQRTAAVLSELSGWDYEIVFVDDGSTDGTRSWLSAVARTNAHVKVVLLSRNFGHQAALTAALHHVTGDAVVMMDGDLQDEPEAIPLLLEKFEQGADVVYAVRTERQEGWILRSCYAAFYRVISMLADTDLAYGAGDFSLVSRRVVDQMKQLDERHRYLRGLRTWVGFRQVGVPVPRAARHSGRSKYTFGKLFQLAFDGIFSFSVVPLRISMLLGGLTIAASLCFAAYAILVKLFLDRSPVGFTAIILAITFLSGIQLWSLGVIGEYIGRIYKEVKRRPNYVVEEVIEAPKASSEGEAEETPAGG